MYYNSYLTIVISQQITAIDTKNYSDITTMLLYWRNVTAIFCVCWNVSSSRRLIYCVTI